MLDNMHYPEGHLSSCRKIVTFIVKLAFTKGSRMVKLFFLFPHVLATIWELSSGNMEKGPNTAAEMFGKIKKKTAAVYDCFCFSLKLSLTVCCGIELSF